MFYQLILTICMGSECKANTLPDHYATMRECRAARNQGQTYAAYKTAGDSTRTFMFECRLMTAPLDKELAK
jgi:hypothetical protein